MSPTIRHDAHSRVAARMRDVLTEARERRQPTATLDGWRPASLADAARFLRWALTQAHADMIDTARAWLAWFVDVLRQLTELSAPADEPLPHGHDHAPRTAAARPPRQRRYLLVQRPAGVRAPASLRLRMA